MTHLALNLLLSIIWMLLMGDFSTASFVVGLAIGFLAISFTRPTLGSRRYVRAVLGFVRLILAFSRELVRSNLQLARDLLRMSLPFQPGFVAFDIRDLDRTETVVLANLVSLTPGTLSVDLDDAGETLYIHSVYAGDPDVVRSDVRRLANLIHGAIGEPAFSHGKETR